VLVVELDLGGHVTAGLLGDGADLRSGNNTQALRELCSAVQTMKTRR
jgi:hypothetical protein